MGFWRLARYGNDTNRGRSGSVNRTGKTRGRCLVEKTRQYCRIYDQRPEISNYVRGNPDPHVKLHQNDILR
jgi:hypothetical protein